MKNINELTFKVISMGCKVNYYETECMSRILTMNGLKRLTEKDETDIAIINTCTVTEEASRKSKQMIRRCINKIKSNIVIVSGCLAQIDTEIEKIDGVNIVLGTSNKGLIYDCIKEYLKTKENIINRDKDIFHSSFEEYTIDKFDAHTRAFLKVEDGCTNFCSYCIIPYARGNVRSKPLNKIIEEAKELVSNGHKEIVVTGIDTGSYGRDLGITFYDLLKELDKIEGLLRIRISSLEISQLNENIIELIKNSAKIVKHIHIPLQSGSDRILKLMNRHYDRTYFIDKVKEIREKIDNISITTDFIVGFPTETDDDFNESLDTLNKINFETIHTFPYSKRNGTKASLLTEVTSDKKKERSKKVLEISKENQIRYMNDNLNKELDCLFETYENGYIYGHTGNYIYCKCKGTISDLNKIYKIKLLNIEKDAVNSVII